MTDINKNEKDESIHSLEAIVQSINRSQAVIEFTLDGIITKANENFLNTMGYQAGEILGKHHRIFCESQYANSDKYKEFWSELSKGKYQSSEYKRIGKDGREVWIQATYNPVLDKNGRPEKVIKFAIDITKQKTLTVDFEGQISAISKSQAVIEFGLDGIIRTANDNFLKATGYSIDEIKGKHHRIFCEDEYVQSAEYQLFWKKLKNGEYSTGEYKRVGKGGKEVWLSASYNPIHDLNGKVVKVIKYASNITQQKLKTAELIKTLAETSSELENCSHTLSAASAQLLKSAKGTSNLSSNASSAADEILKGIQSMAINTQEMNISIKEISKNTSTGSEKTTQCMRKAKETNDIVNKLGDESKEIGTVIKTISAIAQQTNLLALNATIEAARAGDAGKGFAVVANEVKELSRQTAKATEEITKKINTIQSSTQISVGEIASISKSVDEINAITIIIAAAIEEQKVASSTVAKAVTDSSKSVETVVLSIKEVAAAASESSTSAVSLSKYSDELKMLAINLRDLIRKLDV